MTNRSFPGLGAGLVLFCLTTVPALAQQLPPPQVSVQVMTPEALPVVNELPGRVAATRTAEVRPRVGGIVLERVFEQGGKVAAGDVLYRIDPAPFDVRVASAKGTLARAEATELNAADQEKRARALRERKVTAGVDLDNAATALAQARADVTIARAALQEAELNRSYTEVTAPISGVVGRALVTEGALVNAQTDIMATIQQLDPVYVDFTQSSSELFALRRALAAGQLAMMSAGEARVQLIFDDGSEYEHPGKLLFSEASVDSTTGQITLRAEFPNPDGNLLPGLYVRVRIEQAVRDNALTVPQMAVQRDQSGQAYVYALKGDDMVERRDVTLGQTSDNRWLVEKGLAPGDRVVVAGAQKLYPDAKVVAQPVAAKPVPAGAAAVAEAPVEAPAETPVAPAKE
ncbi:efflux RND transporter periplasmic adaptor subunit [Paracoccus aminovorans]|uniref:efflux RND transporter periplasmic adaptor subunit n=1 Tax=Paracoccus aminovorans TaxID=34004 RepID=UPI0007818D48|nr:efflux RND transporter periplasmic adaptor subunit [Paracoccus aminovorans]MDQ7777930.1 efflux RND transporter periplasmic adaptor subunit [Paracoccus aminovorans]